MTDVDDNNNDYKMAATMEQSSNNSAPPQRWVDELERGGYRVWGALADRDDGGFHRRLIVGTRAGDEASLLRGFAQTRGVFAVKTYALGDTVRRRQAYDEWRAAMRLGGASAFVVAPVDWLWTPSVAFAVAPLQPGGTLMEWATRVHQLHGDDVVAIERHVRPIVAQVARALRHMHANGVAHLDVRVEHVVLNARGEARLINLAHAYTGDDDDWRMCDGVPRGTMGYAAPEMLTCVGFDSVGARAAAMSAVRLDPRRCDAWSLGALAYYLLTLRLPHDADAIRRTIRRPSRAIQLLHAPLWTAHELRRLSPHALRAVRRWMRVDARRRWTIERSLGAQDRMPHHLHRPTWLTIDAHLPPTCADRAALRNSLG